MLNTGKCQKVCVFSISRKNAIIAVSKERVQDVYMHCVNMFGRVRVSIHDSVNDREQNCLNKEYTRLGCFSVKNVEKMDMMKQ